MRTTTLALLSGAAMSISAASIYNVTPAGGFGAETYASLDSPSPRGWPHFGAARDTPARGAAEAVASATAAPTAFPNAFAGGATEPLAAFLPSTAFATAEPITTSLAIATPPIAERPKSRAPSTKLRSPGWRNVDAVPATTRPVHADPQRIVDARQQRAHKTPMTSFVPQPEMFQQQAAPSASFPAPMSTSSARVTSTSR
jgi:hypothetical protein